MAKRLRFQPETYTGLQKGINCIADAVRPTLGPLPRLVAVDPVSRGNVQPELLDNAGLIARRILALPDRDADMGAMLLRQLLWKQHEQAGDGTATTAVLFQSIYNQGVRYIAAGGNAMRLRHSLEQGLCLLLDEMQRQTIPLITQQQMTQLALSICRDEALAQALGEIFDTLGAQGAIEVRSGYTRGVEWEFVEGSYFKSGLISSAASGERSVELVDAAIFISDLPLDDPQDLVRLVALSVAAGKKALAVVTRQLSEKAGALLTALNNDPERFRIAAIKPPLDPRALDDLALLTGGRALLSATGDLPSAVKMDDLGMARRAWADRDYFGIVGGKGSPRSLRAHTAGLSRAFEATEDMAARKQLRERLGTLRGGAAVLRVGGSNDLEIKARKELAERTAEAVRGGVAGGGLPGAGAALLACRPALKREQANAESLDQRMAYSILSRALEEPARAIISNAGYDAAPILGQITEAGAAFDARSGSIVDAARAGLFDSAGVLLSAVRGAVSSAALALTIDVLFHYPNPKTSVNP